MLPDEGEEGGEERGEACDPAQGAAGGVAVVAPQAAPADPAASTAASSEAAAAEAERQATMYAKWKADCEQTHQNNADRMAARKALMTFTDTLRCHFHCVAISMSTDTGTDEERFERGWTLWRQGLEGHCLRGDHSHCGVDAECRKDGYKST